VSFFYDTEKLIKHANNKHPKLSFFIGVHNITLQKSNSIKTYRISGRKLKSLNKHTHTCVWSIVIIVKLTNSCLLRSSDNVIDVGFDIATQYYCGDILMCEGVDTTRLLKCCMIRMLNAYVPHDLYAGVLKY